MKTMNKWQALNIIILLCYPFSMVAQVADELTMKVPEGSSYSLLSNIEDVESIRCVSSKSDGKVYYVKDNTIGCFGDGHLIEIPSRVRPISMCWTNNGTLVLFSNDTLFAMDKRLVLRPLVSIVAPKLILRSIGESDFAFCVVNDTVVYRYCTESDSLISVVKLDNPIGDFIVDNEDYYLAYGKRVVAFTQEKEFIPILIDSDIITNIAFCGRQSFLLSTQLGLWYINEKREKELILDQPITKMMTDDYDRAFIMLQDGTWLFLSHISRYETEQE